MNKAVFIATGMLALGVLAGCTSSTKPTAASQPSAVIPAAASQPSVMVPVEEVFKRGIIGRLGLPVGTIVRIHGTLRVYTRTKLRSEVITVDQVDGQMVDPITVSIDRNSRVSEDRHQVTLIGYETCGYSGDVGGLVQDVGYGFQDDFVALQDGDKDQRKLEMPNWVAGMIPYSEVAQRGIVGKLGLPMGKVVTIHATVVRVLDSNRGQASIQVDRISNRALSHPFVIGCEAWEVGVITLPSEGQPVTLTGYETCGYSGTTAGEVDYMHAIEQGTGYAFSDEFVVMRIGDAKPDDATTEP